MTNDFSLYFCFNYILLQIPENKNEWQQIANDFQQIWHIPHTLGALDGKHIRIIAPTHSGSTFYNYKGFFSIVLFALADAHSRFIYINVGANGKSSDSTIYRNSYLYKALQEGTLNIPDPSPLSRETGPLPYFFIADDAFSLDKNLMKPYNRNLSLRVPQEIFNYRICRGRMTIEMAFGRLANRFRIFHKAIEVSPDTCDIIIKTCCVLHNYLTKKRILPTDCEERADEVLPQHISSISTQNYNTYKFSNRIRDKLSLYFVSDGNVSFQWRKINRALS